MSACRLCGQACYDCCSRDISLTDGQSATNDRIIVPVPGQKGDTPLIGPNMNWWIGGKDTGERAIGEDGEDGDSPYVGSNGNWWVGSVDTGVKAKGDKGDAPYIGENGNWWIGDVDTGVSASGDITAPVRGEDIFNR